ncbi:MAG: hypothetical protein AAGG09_17635 [Pseudomonadota bacterium]
MEFTTAVAVYGKLDMPALSVLWTLVLLLGLLPTAAVLGWWLGRTRRRQRLEAGLEIDMVVGETTLGAILAILGLLLAFSFGNALNFFEVKKSRLVDESAAIGTAFLRADYLTDPARTELQVALLDYAETRVVPRNSGIESSESALAFLDRTLQAQAKLWPLTLEATADPTPPAIKTFVAGAMNEVIDLHLYRVVTIAEPVSDFAYAMMLATALAALFLLGDRAGMLGRALTWRTFVLSGFLTVVMITIVDLQRSNAGLIVIDQTPINATIFDMRAALDGRLP